MCTVLTKDGKLEFQQAAMTSVSSPIALYVWFLKGQKRFVELSKRPQGLATDKQKCPYVCLVLNRMDPKEGIKTLMSSWMLFLGDSTSDLLLIRLAQVCYLEQGSPFKGKECVEDVQAGFGHGCPQQVLACLLLLFSSGFLVCPAGCRRVETVELKNMGIQYQMNGN